MIMGSYPPGRPASVAPNAKRPDQAKAARNPDSVGARSSERWLLRIDGSFEALFGAVLVFSAATNLYRWLALPNPPASRVVLVVFGLLFLALCPVLWRLSRAPQHRLLLELALANGVGALILLLWALAWNRSFQPAGAVFVLVVAGILAILAALQTHAASGTGE